MSPMWSQYPAQASQYMPPASGIEALFQRLERIEKQVAELTGANILGPAGLVVDPNGLTIGSSLLVTGNTRIEGTLSLPAGIIDNDALASPVVPAPFKIKTNTWATTGATETQATATLTVPAGFTKAVVTATVTANVYNSSTLPLLLAVYPVINGVVGEPGEVDYGTSRIGRVSATLSELVTGLTGGGTFTVRADVNSQTAQPAKTVNVATVNGTVLWVR